MLSQSAGMSLAFTRPRAFKTSATVTIGGSSFLAVVCGNAAFISQAAATQALPPRARRRYVLRNHMKPRDVTTPSAPRSVSPHP